MKLRQEVTTLARPVDLTGRTALVVGATAGIGRAVAGQLADLGATVILAGRDPGKLAAAAAALEGAAPGRVRTQLADLADLASVRHAAAAIAATYPALDITVANASIMSIAAPRTFTRDGFEATFGVNHLGNAALLLGLEAPIRAATGGRVVIVASEAHRRAGGLPLDDLMGERRYGGGRAYARSKLANILFARQLALRWPETTVYAAHPGGVLTDMLRRAVSGHVAFRAIFRLIRRWLLTPAQAAAGIVRLAADPDLDEPSGTYFELGRRDRPGALARDAALAAALFDRTCTLIGDPASTSLPVPSGAPAARRPARAAGVAAGVVGLGLATVALAARRAGVSRRAWLLLRTIPMIAPAGMDGEALAEAIRADRARGPGLPSKRLRTRFAFSDERWGDIRVLRLAARGTGSPPKLLYLHGGAYVFDLQSLQWAPPAGLLERLGGEVVAPLYPLAPEAGWRAGQAAVLAAYQRLAAEAGARNVVVVADSAGGGLALALARQLHAAGDAMPAALVLFSPWLDTSVTGADQPGIAPDDPALSIAFLRAAGRLWAGDTPLDDPGVSPLFGDLAGLPPTLVFTGTRDILDSDARRLAARAPGVTVRRYPGMFHVWPAAPIPEARRALDEAAAFVRDVLGGAEGRG